MVSTTDARTRLLELLRESVTRGSFVRLQLSRYTGSEPDLRRLLVRPVIVQDTPHLSFVWHYARRDITRNHTHAEALALLASLAGGDFLSAHLSTTTRDWQLSATRDGSLRLAAHKPARRTAPETSHDLPSGRLLDPRLPFLRELAITDAEGRVRERMGSKYRQVCHFAGILDSLVDDLGWRPGGKPVDVVDMGAGKGCLTFAAWHVLRSQRGLDARVTGVEQRPELVAPLDEAARRLGCTGLRFTAGTIADIPLDGVTAVIALHACNTATDDALLRGIRAGADLLLAAPCCHQELRPQLDAGRRDSPLAPLLVHGLLRERFAEWLTDGLRALYLEWAGYETRVIEFVASEHTPRNLLLAAIRRERLIGPDRLREQIESLKSAFGIARHALDDVFRPLPNPAR